MNGFLVDTNVLSELTRTKPEPQVEKFLHRSKDRVFISVLSIGEIRKGIASLPLNNKRAQLQDWLDNEIMPWFGAKVLPVTLSIAEEWGDLAGQMKTVGRPRPVFDALLAATAAKHDLVLVTRNEKDYAGLDATIFNPWQPA